MRNKIHIEFGTPKYGWLPTIFNYGDYKLEIEISNVPLDPMAQLSDTLIKINKGVTNPERIIWHLEPYCYYLQLEVIDKKYKAIILESDEFDGPTKITKEITGNFNAIILPLYYGFKKYYLQSFTKPHWKKLNPKKFEELVELIKVKKENKK